MPVLRLMAWWNSFCQVRDIKLSLMRTKLLNDQELIVSYLQGNEQALEKLILKHKQKVYTSIYCMVKDEYLAEDIFQETFIKVIDKLRSGKYNEEGKFAPWLMRIAYNMCMDHFRKTNREPGMVTGDTEELFHHIASEETPVEDHINLERLEGSLKGLIENLPEEQKEVVVLRHYFNFSFKEVAEKTNTPLNTCLGRMRYALVNLRKMMNEQERLMRA
jgi:RNA polymerase sigma factor (sigma-70 family)